MSKTIIVANAERIRQGKRALLTAATKMDNYRVQGGTWRNMLDWQHGQRVSEVRHFGRHTTAVGDTVGVEDDTGRKHGRVEIESIEMVDTDKLTVQHLDSLGYDSWENFAAAEPGYQNRRAWLVRIRPVKRFLWR